MFNLNITSKDIDNLKDSKEQLATVVSKKKGKKTDQVIPKKKYATKKPVAPSRDKSPVPNKRSQSRKKTRKEIGGKPGGYEILNVSNVLEDVSVQYASQPKLQKDQTPNKSPMQMLD